MKKAWNFASSTEASTDLMKLYNKKRQTAEAKDDEKVKEYMDKVQNLMQMSKDMIRGKCITFTRRKFLPANI